MIIKKYTGKTMEEAKEKAIAELGQKAVIMNTREVKKKGILGAFQKPICEVTAAIEDQPIPEKKPEAEATPKPAGRPAEAVKAYQQAISEASNELLGQPSAGAGKTSEQAPSKDEQELGKRIDSLQQFIEDKFKDQNVQEKLAEASGGGQLPIMRLIYRSLIDNEVDERYANAFIEEIQKGISSASGLDQVLATAYQKLVLKFGKTSGISLGGKKPKLVFFIGPTGVGKTTTIAKIASHYKVEEGKNIALITSDTYRIAATDQLRVYANILNIPLAIIYSADELNRSVESYSDYDLIMVDTAGFSHKNAKQKNELRDLLEGLNPDYEKEVYLVLSSTTKYKDLVEIVEAYAEFSDYKLLFTKLDETNAYGNLLNIKLHTGADMSYLTVGQNVPDDIELFSAQKIVKQLLGGN